MSTRAIRDISNKEMIPTELSAISEIITLKSNLGEAISSLNSTEEERQSSPLQTLPLKMLEDE